MKEIFKKYLTSVSTPDEFDKITEFIKDRRNEYLLSKWLKEHFEYNMKSQDDLPEPKRELFDLIIQKIDRQEYLSAKRKLTIYKWSFRFAAVFLFGILISGIFFYQKNLQKAKNQYTAITTPPGEKTKLMLPDSSIVWLNSGSTLKYSKAFNFREREVELIGEGYFEVRSNKTKVFTVKTESLNVKVYGTSFNIKGYDDDRYHEITVADGIVGVLNGKKEIKKLTKGEQALFDKQMNTISFLQQDIEHLASWRNNELIFDNTPIVELKKSLERWYGVSIMIDSAMQNRHNYTFKLKTESLREVLKMMRVMTPLEYKIDGDDVFIEYAYE